MAGVEGKRIVITGSTRGLGQAAALALAAAGARVVLNGTNEVALAETLERIRASGGEAAGLAGSVAETRVCEALIGTCVSRYGGIDVLINNAGLVRDRTLFKMTAEDFDEVIAVHLRGSWACGKYAALAMRDQGGGQIINVTSNSGLCGGFGQSNYAAAKAGVLGLMRTWVLELARYGIRCNAFWPIAETDMTQVVFANAAKAASARGEPAPSPTALGFGTADEVAQGLLWLAGDEAAHFNGQCVTFSGRKTALWTHPAEVHVRLSAQPMSATELATHYAGVPAESLFEPSFTA